METSRPTDSLNFVPPQPASSVPDSMTHRAVSPLASTASTPASVFSEPMDVDGGNKSMFLLSFLYFVTVYCEVDGVVDKALAVLAKMRV